MIDAEAYIGQINLRDFEALRDDLDMPHVAPDIDTETLEEIPAIIWNLSGDGQQADGPGMWTFVLSYNIFGDGMDQAKAYARLTDRVANSWFADPWPTALEVDGDRIVISGGETIDLPTRTAQSIIDGRNVVQYSGSYAIMLRS